MNDSLLDIAGDAVNATKDDYLALQAQQLEAGKDSTSAITLDGKSGYALSTIKQKQRTGVGIGAITDRITLFGKGSFYNSLSLSVKGNDIYVYSGLYYIGFVTARTAHDPLGLGGEYKNEYINGPFSAALFDKIKDLLNGV